MKYPDFQEFAEIYKFIKSFRVGAYQDSYFAHHPKGGPSYEASKGGEQLMEVPRVIAPTPTNILKKPYVIDSEEKFAWVLFCKMKERQLQKRTEMEAFSKSTGIPLD